MSDLEQSDNEGINSVVDEESEMEEISPLAKLQQTLSDITSTATNVFKSDLNDNDREESDVDENINDDSDDDYKPPPPPNNDMSDSDIESDDSDSDVDENFNDDSDGNEDIVKKNKSKNTIKKNNMIVASPVIDIPVQYEKNESDYDSSDDEDEDDDYLQKFDKEQKNNYILEQHPECEIHNYNEIYNLAKVQRNKNNIIVDDLHKTIPILTKYEKTRILGIRAKQINNGAQPMVTINTQIIDGYLIALKELEEKKIPIIIRRPIPNGASEYWHLKDLEIL